MQDAGYRRIPLVRRDGTIVGWTRVDEVDFERLSQWTWRLSTHGRVYHGAWRDGRYVTVYMAREVFGLPCGSGEDARRGLQVDHIHGDKLDHRRSELRIVTNAGNAQNVTVAWGTSQHRGVHFDRDRNKWVAKVRQGGRDVFRKRFDTEQEAADAAREARAAFFEYTTT